MLLPCAPLGQVEGPHWHWWSRATSQEGAAGAQISRLCVHFALGPFSMGFPMSFPRSLRPERAIGPTTAAPLWDLTGTGQHHGNPPTSPKGAAGAQPAPGALAPSTMGSGEGTSPTPSLPGLSAHPTRSLVLFSTFQSSRKGQTSLPRTRT